MTREDIIRMAREAGFVVGVSVEHWGDVPFAKLCHPAPTSTALYRMLESLVSRVAAAARAEENEACAKACEILGAEDDSFYAEFSRAKDCAEAIRTRGEKP